MTKPQANQKHRQIREPAARPQAPGHCSGAKQLAAFEAAMKLFHARKFKEARESVRSRRRPARSATWRSARGCTSPCATAACSRPPVNLGTAEEYYNYGVALINARNIAEARTHLEKALADRARVRTHPLRPGAGAGAFRRSRRAPTRTCGGRSNWSRAIA